jgi:hypothetical protein
VKKHQQQDQDSGNKAVSQEGVPRTGEPARAGV